MKAAADGPEESVDPDLDEVGGGPVHLRVSSIALVWLGGTLGTGSRYLLTSVISRPQQLPPAIFMINVGGAFLLGVLIERLASGGPDRGVQRRIRLLAGTGFLGGFTTYSTLAMDSVSLLYGNRPTAFLAYALGTLILGAVATRLGMGAGRLGRQHPVPR
jgi:CrcB protein